MSEIKPLQVKYGKDVGILSFTDNTLNLERQAKAAIKIPAKNILDLSLDEKSLITIKAVTKEGKQKHQLMSFIFEPEDSTTVKSWSDSINDAICLVIVNPNSGTKKSHAVFVKEVKPVFDAAKCTYDVTYTQHKNHGNEIVQGLELKSYDAIITVGGDGIIHEVVNGLLTHKDYRNIPIGVIPSGSGNALSISLHGEVLGLNPTYSALAIIKGIKLDIDICSITQGKERCFSFLTQSYGISADCDLGTENMRWMGDLRFIIGAVKAILEGRRYKCDLAIKISEENKETIKRTYQNSYKSSLPISTPTNPKIVDKYGSVNDDIPEDWKIINDDLFMFYTGKVPWVGKGFLCFPAALPNDGLLDLTLVKRDAVNRKRALDILSNAQTGSHFDQNEVEYYKIEAFRLTPKNKSGYISIDGESFKFEPFQVEVHPQLISVIGMEGKYFPKFLSTGGRSSDQVSSLFNNNAISINLKATLSANLTNNNQFVNPNCPKSGQLLVMRDNEEKEVTSIVQESYTSQDMPKSTNENNETITEITVSNESSGYSLEEIKNDIEKIKSLKQKAMQDPIQYVEGIMAGVYEKLPKIRNILEVPKIDWSKYHTSPSEYKPDPEFTPVSNKPTCEPIESVEFVHQCAEKVGLTRYNKREPTTLKKSHAKRRSTDSKDHVHYGHSCSSCNKNPIVGTRFVCRDCKGLDLCEECTIEGLFENEHHNKSHQFIVITKPATFHFDMLENVGESNL
nr:4256_t:CDS:10 [Entrophospora candida]